MPLASLLQTPKKHFFWLYNMMPRVRAEQNLNMLKVLVASQSTQEGFELVAREWQDEMGIIYQGSQTVATFSIEDENAPDPEFDRAGLRALKFKHGV